MPDRGRILGFVVRFGLLFGLLTTPWPGLHDGFGCAFRTATGILLSAALPGHAVWVKPAAQAKYRSADTEILVTDSEGMRSDGTAPTTVLLLNGRSLGWMPNVMWLALVGATPIPWRSRGRGLVGGMAIVNGFVLATTLILVAQAVRAESWPGWCAAVLVGADRALSQNLWSSFVLPALVWIVWLLLPIRKQQNGPTSGVRIRM